MCPEHHSLHCRGCSCGNTGERAAPPAARDENTTNGCRRRSRVSWRPFNVRVSSAFWTFQYSREAQKLLLTSLFYWRIYQHPEAPQSIPAVVVVVVIYTRQKHSRPQHQSAKIETQHCSRGFERGNTGKGWKPVKFEVNGGNFEIGYVRFLPGKTGRSFSASR